MKKYFNRKQRKNPGNSFLKPGILTFLLLCLPYIPSHGGIIITGGILNTDATWMDTVHVTDNIIITDGVTLTIESGTRVEFQGYFGITVQGRILAQGLPGDTIRFLPKDTLGFYDILSPSGSWRGILFNTVSNTNDTSRFTYCKFSFAKNTSSDAGSALAINGFSRLSIQNCLFTNNIAKDRGGAVYTKNAFLRIQNTGFRKNHSNISGGAVYAGTHSLLIFNNCDFTDNQAIIDGGALFNDGDSINISHSSFTSNKANNNGGGIYSKNNIVYLDKTKFTTNYCMNYGGGLYAEAGKIYVTINEFKNNSSDMNGGAIYTKASTNLNNSKIVENNADNGAGIYIESENAFLWLNAFQANNAALSGGAIYCIKRGLHLLGNNFFNNTANTDGAVLYNKSAADLQVITNFIRNNIANGKGGGLYIDNSPNSWILNSVITNNEAHYGGGIYLNECTGALISANTIASNKAITISNGEAIFFNNSPALVANTIIWDNSVAYTGTPPSGKYSTYSGVFPGTTVEIQNMNPQFMNASVGKGNQADALTADWSLKLISPCFNRGTPNIDTSGLKLRATDIAGNPRIMHDTIDIGAYEISKNITITHQPDSIRVCHGNKTFFFVKAIGTQLNYTWYHNDIIVPTVNNDTLYIHSATGLDSGKYNCIISNGYTTAGSDTGHLYVNPLPENYFTLSDPVVCAKDTAHIIQSSSRLFTNYELINKTGDTKYRTLPGTGLPLDFDVVVTVPSTFFVKAIDIKTGCSSKLYDSAQVTVNPLPNALLPVTSDTICAGDTAMIYIRSSQPSVAYQMYRLSDRTPVGTIQYGNGGNLLFRVSPVSPTTYFFTARNSFSCETELQNKADVKVNPVPITNFLTLSDPEVCSGDTAIIVLSGSGTLSTYQLRSGTTPVSPVIPGTGSSLSFKVFTLTNHSYNILVSNQHGCKSEITDKGNVTVNNLPSATINADTTACSGSPVECKVNVVSAANGYSILWSTGSTGQTITVVTAGTYSATITDGNGCKTTLSRLVNYNPLPSVDAGPSKIIPTNTSATFEASASPGVDYLWTPGSLLENDTIEDAKTLNLTSSAIFKLEVTYPATGCKNSDSVQVTVTGGALTVTASVSNATVCSGTTLALGALVSGGSTPYSYTWSSIPSGFSSTLQNPTHTPAASTTYIIQVTDGNSTAADTVSVTVYPLPVISISQDSTVCKGNPVTIAASGAGSFLWNDGSTQSAFTVIPLSTTLYQVTGTDANGCTDTKNTTIIVKDKPFIFLGNDILLCAGNQTLLQAPAGMTTYLWSTGDNTSSITTGTGGNYSVTITNSAGCSNNDSILISIIPSPTVFLGADVARCNYSSELIDAGTGYKTYLWSTGAITQSINVTTTGIYTVTVTNDYDCRASASKQVTLYPVPDATISYTPACINDITRFSTTATGVTWNWMLGNGEISTLQNPSTVYTTAGSYTVTLRVETSYGCRDSAAIAIVVTNKPLAKFGYTAGCNSIKMIDSTTVTGTTINQWLWVFNNGVNITGQDITYDVAVNGAVTSATLIVTTNQGCKDTATGNVQSLIVPEASFTYSPSPALVNSDVQFTDQSKNTVEWRWEFGIHSEVSVKQNPVFKYDMPGKYRVFLTATSADKCTDTASLKVTVGGPVAVPTAFSPNNDNINDIHYVLGGPFKEFDFRVYSRWGNVIFTSTNQDIGWDGKLNGINQPAGVYTFTLKATTIEGQIIEQTGNLTLLR